MGEGKVFFVVAYDITDDGIRNKVAQLLENYGQRVQYSCFEVEIPRKNQVTLIKAYLNSWLEPTDRAFLYPITERAKGSIIRFPDEKRKLIEELLKEYPKLSRGLLRTMFRDQLELKFRTIKRIENYLIIYDIEDDTVRNRLSDYLGSIGIRVQLSVFEVETKPYLMPPIIEKLAAYSNYGKIHIYPLDKDSLKGIIRIGKIYSDLDFNY